MQRVYSATLGYNKTSSDANGAFSLSSCHGGGVDLWQSTPDREPFRDALIKAIHDHPILIIVGETGSGKTTQIPQYLINDQTRSLIFSTRPDSRLACTQPRRVAAMSVATRVAHEMHCNVGDLVGYSIRFEQCYGQKTKVVYLTDGMLLREFLTEPELASYSVIMLDEAHERTLHTDILLVLLKSLVVKRMNTTNPLRLIISSATLEAERFSDFFGGAPVFTIPGRTHPVDTFYTKAPELDYLAATVQAIIQLHVHEPPGDILAFLTGQDEIESAEEMLWQHSKQVGKHMQEMWIVPVFGAMPSEQQQAIFKPAPQGARKVVLATNIAETSITIPGIVYVVDCGMCKQKAYNPRTGVESLVIVPISKASARQRAGRAGRQQPGKCFRLYTEEAFDKELTEVTIPEVQRSNLIGVILLLKSIPSESNVISKDVLKFDWMDPPPKELVIRALQLLYALGAIDHHGTLTRLGRLLAEFPLDPMMSRALIASIENDCTQAMLSIGALLSTTGSIMVRPRRHKEAADAAHSKLESHDDLLTLLNIWVLSQDEQGQSLRTWCMDHFVHYRAMLQARDIREQLSVLIARICQHLETGKDQQQSCGGMSVITEADLNSPEVIKSIKRSFLAGYFAHSARLNQPGQGGDRRAYTPVKRQPSSADLQMFIHPSSTLFIKNRFIKKNSDAEDQLIEERMLHDTESISALSSSIAQSFSNSSTFSGESPQYVCYYELVETSKEYMRNVMAIENPEWLLELAPHYYNPNDVLISTRKKTASHPTSNLLSYRK